MGCLGKFYLLPDSWGSGEFYPCWKTGSTILLNLTGRHTGSYTHVNSFELKALREHLEPYASFAEAMSLYQLGFGRVAVVVYEGD